MAGALASTVTVPSVDLDWAAGANAVLAQVGDAAAAGWPIGAAIIALFVGWRIVKRMVKG